MGMEGKLFHEFMQEAEVQLLRGLPCEDLAIWARERRIQMLRVMGHQAAVHFLDVVGRHLKAQAASAPCKRAAYLAICDGLERA